MRISGAVNARSAIALESRGLRIESRVTDGGVSSEL
jgi:hypothetical protein